MSLRKTKKLRQGLEKCLMQLTVGLVNGARCELPPEAEFRTLVSRFEKKAGRFALRLKRAFTNLEKPMPPPERLRINRRILKATHQVSGRLHTLLVNLRAVSDGNPHADQKGELRAKAKFAIASLEPVLLALSEVAERAEKQKERFENLHGG